MTKIAVIGEGYIGSRVREHFGAVNIPEAEIDITDLQSVRRALLAYPADVVMNLAAATNTAALEKPENQDGGFRANVQGPANLALACREQGRRLVHMSTGMMFDGFGPNNEGWREGAVPEPENYYAWTKAWADCQLLPFLERDGILILRIHMPISGQSHPRNLLNKMMTFEKAVDVESSMTVLEDLLKAAEKLIAQEATGIYHVVNPGLMSPYRIVEIMKEEGVVQADKLVGRITQAELDAMGGAKQAFPLLNTEKLRAAGVELDDIETAVRKCARRLKEAREEI